ncbi:MAG: DNA-binding protein [Candidatus Entotheonella gemina]|uniref:DNA-binding protein n=1 Tax=Candidatus Entotheonella gemina TaxID=1429439 RepID=W4LZK9_9BACT|nr:MAG: DNA-binding protein [Candidatus Entotheonella gemina]
MLAFADEKLRAAKLLVEGGAWGDASSRAYYAAFHAVSAALLSRNETYSRHGQVLGAFNRRFIHPGFFPPEFTALLTRLFENRQSGDYDVLPGVTEDEARQDIVDAQRIIEAIRQFLAGHV